ncbi:MAG: nucleotidyltransferase family protein [Anaerolineaceae bacterium]|nr:nucleotidyltransferase family protein [Anaerolineaceae bacterium]
MQNFNPLSALLKILEPGLPLDESYDVVQNWSTQDWEALIKEADLQLITPLLYPLISKLQKSYPYICPVTDKVYKRYIAVAARNTLALHDTEILVDKLCEDDIDIAGLKGIYLLEHVYGNIGVRSMADIDVLVKKENLSRSYELMQELGYHASTYFSLGDQNIDIKHLPPLQKDLNSPVVELHWTILEEDEPFTIDPQAIWERAKPVKVANSEVFTLGFEDLILHLCIHLTYQHYLNLGLRGLMDVAMVIHRFQNEIDWQKLVAISHSWGSQKVTALTLKLVETQLNISIPEEVYPKLLPEGLDQKIFENARDLLFDRQQSGILMTPDLVELEKNQNLFSRLKIAWNRLFLPRLTLARLYNVPPNSIKILGCYWKRFVYLLTNYGKTLSSFGNREKNVETALQKAGKSYALHDWMSPTKK